MNRYIFSDFDGTISKYDVIHTFIKTFAKGDWSESERKWARGEISTKDCLKIQMGLVKNLKLKDFDNFLNSVEIDPYFLDFYNLVKKSKDNLIVISDGFDFFIKRVLSNYNINDIKIYSNHIDIIENEGYIDFKITYPNLKKDCLIGAGCCKCSVAKEYSKDYIYIGDGLSDRCIAKDAQLLFAKKSLETFCKENKFSYIPYKTFQDIIDAIYKERQNANNDVGFINGKSNQRA